jgi:hypothetical protein
LGFNNVIDAFHVVNRGEIPVRFFSDERKNGGGIRLTDELFRLRERLQFGNLPQEVEARWRLVETAWQLTDHQDRTCGRCRRRIARGGQGRSACELDELS